jgi:hypothetical protein
MAITTDDENGGVQAAPKKRSVSPDPGADADEGARAIGVALRGAYQATVDETVPDEMIALLGKLS